MTAAIRVDLLGGVDVSGVDPAQVHGSARAVSLLAYLVSHPDLPQPRSHLAGLLWPDSQSAQARTNLRRELHHLRVLLQDNECLEVDARSLCWRCGPDGTVDVQDFRTAYGSAITALESGERDALELHSGAALTLYRGHFLPGCYDDWAVAVRDDLSRTCVDLCDRVARYWLTHEDAAAAIGFARRRVLLEPLEEPGYRLLMQALRAVGDRSGAMRTYHQCATLLERELGVGPSLETQAELDETLCAVAPGSGDIGSRGSSDTVRWPASPGLVGRVRESEWLLSSWRQAQSGAHLLVVTGEAGVGKTRLVADLVAAVRRQDALVATTRCFAAAGSVPLAPVADWLRSPRLRMATHQLDPVWRAEVGRLVPQADSATEPVAGVRAKVDAWQRLRFFEGLARAFRAVDRPLLLTLDDLQWCDKASMSWLSFLISFMGSSPLLVVATAREDELVEGDLTGRLDTMRAAGQATLVTLENLAAHDASTLAAGVLGRPVGDQELRLLMSTTGGNPFYLVEALRRASTLGPVEPADLRDVLDSRMARLPKPAREVVSLAAAVGRDFTLNLLIEASDLAEDTVVRQVDDLWRRRIFEERGRGYDFAHDLLREAAYRMITPPGRWLLHRRLAQALELLYADRIDSVAAQLAEQHDRSGRPERALPFYERAAGQATAVFAHAESVRFWQRCLALLGELPMSSERDRRELVTLQELLPPMNAWRGYASTELEQYERRTAALGARLGLVEVQCTAAIALFATTFVQGHTRKAHEWGAQALGLSEERPGLAAQAHLAVAGSGLGLGLLPLADEHFRLACDLAGVSDSLPIGTRTEVHARAWWAHALWLLGDHAGAASAGAAAVHRARLIEHPYSLTVALSYAAVTHQLLGDIASLESTVVELTELCERYGFAYYREWATVLAGWAEGGPTGLRAARAGILALEGEGSLARMTYWLSLVADVHRREGNTTSAVAVLDAAASFATEHDDRWWLPEVLRARAAHEPTPRAIRGLKQAVDLARSQSSTTLLHRCLADLDARTGV